MWYVLYIIMVMYQLLNYTVLSANLTLHLPTVQLFITMHNIFIVSNLRVDASY